MASKLSPRRATWSRRCGLQGDAEGADVWLRIFVAIGTLGEPPRDAGH
jgi:hypothetical protein